MLPSLTAEEQRHSEAVRRALDGAISAAGGWLGFDDYLRLVMYAPGLGYYSAGARKFGPAGDFVTAPELSDLFARCVARQCAQVLQLGGGDVLELGAGSGALAEGVLRMLQQLEQLPQHYYILEVSAELRARQQQRLQALPAALGARVRWLDALPAAPLNGVVLANEVVDALPFQRFLIAPERVLERGIVRSAHGELIEADRPASAVLRAELDRMQLSLAPGFQSELCLMLAPWIAGLAASLARGAVFIIDYGLGRGEYYHPQRAHGTLRCHFRHRAHDDVLLYPGLQDITCWVDFTRVAEAADAAQLQVAAYCTQAAFLLACDIEADVAAAPTPLAQAQLASQARALLLPGEMGEVFKVMALTRGIDAPLRAGALQDLRHLL